MSSFDVSEHDVQDMDAEELADIEDIPRSIARVRMKWLTLSDRVDGEESAQDAYDKIVDIEEEFVDHSPIAALDEELARMTAHKHAVDSVVEQIEEDN